MDEEKLPVGFAMALATNEPAMKAFAHLSDGERRAVLLKARGARSRREMQRLAASLLPSAAENNAPFPPGRS